MNTKFFIASVTALILLAFSSLSQAELYWGADRIEPPKWYEVEEEFSAYSNRESSASGVKFFSGYKASDFFSLELEYKDQMEVGVGDVFTGRELWYGENEQDIDSKALLLSGQSKYEFDGGHYLYMRGGLYNWDVKSGNNDFESTGYLDANGTDLFYSIGSYFDVTDNIGLSTAWERFEYNQDEVDFFSTELRFNF
ncbi:MAG: outer membrane beta-barrel protein [Pseudomonadota bacterium]